MKNDVILEKVWFMFKICTHRISQRLECLIHKSYKNYSAAIKNDSKYFQTKTQLNAVLECHAR